MRETTVSGWKSGGSNAVFFSLVALDSLVDGTAGLERVCLKH